MPARESMPRQPKRLPLPIRRSRPWVGAVVSLVLHGAAITLLVLTGPKEDEHKAKPGEMRRLQPAGPPVSMVFLPPPPSGRPAAPLPAPAPRTEGDAANAPARPLRPPDIPPPDAERAAPPPPQQTDAARPAPPVVPPAPTPSAPAEEPKATALASATPTLESEAHRLFGPHLTLSPSDESKPGAGGQSQPWRPAWADNPTCMAPPSPDDSAGGMTDVSGRVFVEGTHRPVPAAWLQILGTPYGTFSDGSGAYRLVFPAALVANCRTQQVRVTADGYRFSDLTLAAGRNLPSSDVILLRR